MYHFVFGTSHPVASHLLFADIETRYLESVLQNWKETGAFDAVWF